MKLKLSRRLLLLVFVPVLICVLLMGLILFEFESAWDVVVGVQEKDIRDLVSLGGSSIERLWIQPRHHVVQSLSKSPILRKRLEGEVPFETLKAEWVSAYRALEGHFYIYYALTDGTIELYPDLELPEGYDPRVRPWYKAGINSGGGVAWSEPYVEIISKKVVISTVIPMKNDEGEIIGVFGTDITLDGLKDILQEIHLPDGSSVVLLDENGKPFVGTKDKYIKTQSLPEGSESLFVETSAPLSNGWRLAAVVPQESMAAEFARLRIPIIYSSVSLFLLAAVILSGLVAGLVSRTRRLADYFEEVVEESHELRQLFRTHDEFSYLNTQFNKVIRFARLAEEERLSRERSYRLLLERVPIGFYRTRKDGKVLFANTTFAELFGYTRQEIMELRSIEQLYENPEERQEFIHTLLREHEVRDMRYRFVTKSGEPFWISMTAMANVERENFEIEGFIVDITEYVREREELKRLSETDQLTGVANRRAFEAAFERFRRSILAEVRAKEHSPSINASIIIFDVDYFKIVNDSYGHDVGDTILQQIATVEKKILRKGDVFARLGGDEFVILLPDETADTAVTLAQRLQTQIKSIVPPTPLNSFPTLSIGVSGITDTDISLKTLIKQADIALYRAKEEGRNRIVLYS